MNRASVGVGFRAVSTLAKAILIWRTLVIFIPQHLWELSIKPCQSIRIESITHLASSIHSLFLTAPIYVRRAFHRGSYRIPQHIRPIAEP